ncbi:S8 family serine peptidase [Streptomyces buecherae]|uniref:S8 family serine peptidase n=1 Tax=Streptomyces buecherae TaxID=2763006 RepID=UPI0036A8A81E
MKTAVTARIVLTLTLVLGLYAPTHSPAKLLTEQAASARPVSWPGLAEADSSADQALGAAKIAPKLRAALNNGRSQDLVVIMSERADLSVTRRVSGHERRVKSGYQRLRDTARTSQASVRSVLDGSGSVYRSHWLVNSVSVRGADRSLVQRLAALAEVREIRQIPPVELPNTQATEVTKDEADAGWNIPSTKAPELWKKYGVRGEGLVVASIDSGVRFDHPALVGAYRGNLGGGAFSHDYNWFDPAAICAQPSVAPCDNHGHGTHTMGTAIGGAGPEHPIGMAPGATWIAVKGCESSGCSVDSLLDAGEWVVAPTDLRGENPRPEMAPHIVNNSWGTTAHDAFYDEIVARWGELGIFPVFASGNSGPGCDTIGSPADHSGAYTVAAYGPGGGIAKFSSRGSTALINKPDIAAPGQAVLSADMKGGYAMMNGTSMAAPHIAGAVALLWSASPELVGDIPATRLLLASSASPVPDDQCGSTSGSNAVWGAGKLDVLAAADAAPRGQTGYLSVRATRVEDGQPLSAGRVKISNEHTKRLLAIGSDGKTAAALPIGTYRVELSAFARVAKTTEVTVTFGGQSNVALALDAAPTVALRGTAVDEAGFGVAGSEVRVKDAPLPPATTDRDGRFTIAGVPAGSHRLLALGWGCGAASSVAVTTPDQRDVVIRMATIEDSAGHACHGVTPDPISTTSEVALSGDDASAPVALPFDVPHYGKTYRIAHVGTNGYVSLATRSTMPLNSRLPHSGPPNASAMPFWDDLVVDSSASVRTGAAGTAPNRRFAVEWRDVLIYGTAQRITFQAVFSESGGVTLEYLDMGETAIGAGSSATVGIDSEDGTVAMPFSYNRAVLKSGTAFRLEAPGAIQGTVRDSDSHEPIVDAVVTVTRPSGSVLTVRTDREGRYRLNLPLATHLVKVSSPAHAMVSQTVTLAEATPTVERDVDLESNSVYGTVLDESGKPLAGTRVSLTAIGSNDLPTAVTDASGNYRLTALPSSRYDVTMTPDEPCRVTGSATVTVRGSVRVDLALSRKKDALGQWCERTTSDLAPLEGAAVPLTGDDESAELTLPFEVSFYGQTYKRAYVTTNGYLTFLDDSVAYSSEELPDPSTPNAALYPFWDDLLMDEKSSVSTQVTGSAPNRVYTVEWRDMLFFLGEERLTFQVAVSEQNTVSFAYRDAPDNAEGRGNSAVIGIEDASGSDAVEYSHYTPVIRERDVVTFYLR